MFTGIIEEIGKIKKIIRIRDIVKFAISANKILTGMELGDSISVDGVCLTVVKFTKNEFEVDLSPETLNLTTFKHKKNNDMVNLERALKLGDKLGGHFVTGHIDGVGKINQIEKMGDSFIYSFTADDSILSNIVQKGSIAIDGISLTIAELNKSSFSVAIIPYTYNNTTFKYKKSGNLVNIETDMLGKYVKKYIGFEEEHKSVIDEEFLKKYGFL